MKPTKRKAVYRWFPILLSLLLLLTGCSDEQSITFHELSITLPSDFTRDVSDGDPEIDYYLAFSGVQVMLQRMTYPSLVEQEFDFPQTMTTDEFRRLLIESGGYEATLLEIDGIPAFIHEYEGYNIENPDLGSEMYKALCCVFKSKDAMWVVEFSVSPATYEQWETSFMQWAKTIKID